MPFALQLALIVAMFTLTSLTAFAETCGDTNLGKILHSAITNRTHIETTIMEAGLYGEGTEQTMQQLAEEIVSSLPELVGLEQRVSHEFSRAIGDPEGAILALLEGINPEDLVSASKGMQMVLNLNKFFGRAVLEDILPKSGEQYSYVGSLDAYAQSRVITILDSKSIRSSRVIIADPSEITALKDLIVEKVGEFRLRVAELTSRQQNGYVGVISKLERVVDEQKTVTRCEGELLNQFMRSQSIDLNLRDCDPNDLEEEKKIEPFCLIGALNLQTYQPVTNLQVEQRGYWERPVLVFPNGYTRVLYQNTSEVQLERLAE